MQLCICVFYSVQYKITNKVNEIINERIPKFIKLKIIYILFLNNYVGSNISYDLIKL